MVIDDATVWFSQYSKKVFAVPDNIKSILVNKYFVHQYTSRELKDHQKSRSQHQDHNPWVNWWSRSWSNSWKKRAITIKIMITMMIKITININIKVKIMITITITWMQRHTGTGPSGFWVEKFAPWLPSKIWIWYKIDHRLLSCWDVSSSEKYPSE